VGGDVPIDNETLLVIDFVNLKIKPAQSFRCVRRDMVHVHVFIKISNYTSISIYVCTVFKKRKQVLHDLFRLYKYMAGANYSVDNRNDNAKGSGACTEQQIVY
jgi:hypothetical protein